MVIKKYTGISIEIDEDKCIGAGECINVCPTNVFKIVKGKTHVKHIDECVECCACVDACPTKAIKHSSC